MSNTKIPRHIAIIMDGNRRWAKKHGLPSYEGHRHGYKKVKEVGKWCQDFGVKFLTLWAFSTENWKRSQKEVDFLMKLLGQALVDKEILDLKKGDVKLKVIGERSKLPQKIQAKITRAEEMTADCKEMVLILAINYGGRMDIINTVKKIVRKDFAPQEINEKVFEAHLETEAIPDPDIVIRTSGEQRTSGFLIWQAAYSEFHFCSKFWPDFAKEDLEKALSDFTKRERRFGA